MNAISRSMLAAAAMALATPALAWTVWPDLDFEWYANVGKTAAATTPAYPSRRGYIWAPAHLEWTGTHHVSMPGVWIEDDYDRQWRAYALGSTTVLATGPLELRDRDGNVIPITTAGYPIDPSLR